MQGFIFSFVIIVVVYIVAKKKYTERKAKREYKTKREQLEGHAPDNAWIIYKHDDIDMYVRRERCHCGGKVWLKAESQIEDQPNVRVAVCECTRCEEVIRLYFEREYLN